MFDLINRFDRQTLLENYGQESIIKLGKSTVTIIGAGGLGSPILTYLTIAGVGKIIIIDDDNVDVSNLSRQFIHTEDSVSASKVQSAKNFLKKLNSNTKIITVNSHFPDSNSTKLAITSNVIVDATDNFNTKQAIAEFCKKEDKSLVWGTLAKQSGYFASTGLGGPFITECFSTLPNINNRNVDARLSGVLGAACGTIGSLMTMLIFRELIEPEKKIEDVLFYFNGSAMSLQKLRILS